MANKIVEVTATYHHDSKNFHAFVIDESQGIKGMIYVPKDEAVPDSITIRLRTRAEAEAEKEG